MNAANLCILLGFFPESQSLTIPPHAIAGSGYEIACGMQMPGTSNQIKRVGRKVTVNVSEVARQISCSRASSQVVRNYNHF